MSWTEERIERLKSMWERGMTASQIAEELGGVSRNAVIGKAHRLDLQSRPSPVKGGEGETVKSEPRKAAPPKSKVPSPAPAPVRAPAAPAAPRQTVNASMPMPSPHNALTGAQIRSIGPGGFLRQGPGDQAPPTTPAPPRRLVPANVAPEYADKMGHPGEPDFHFCGAPVNPGFPYCVQHCGHAYQAQMPRRDRRPPPPLPFGGPRVR
jgi:GcrA cell cycle regulator